MFRFDGEIVVYQCCGSCSNRVGIVDVSVATGCGYRAAMIWTCPSHSYDVRGLMFCFNTSGRDQHGHVML